MIKNYLKIAWRNLLRNKLYSVINIGGLAIGMAVGILILIWVQDELGYDRFNSKIEHIYKVNAVFGAAESRQVWGSTPGPVAYHALKDVPGVISAVRVIGDYDYNAFSYRDKLLKQEDGNLFVDDSFFTVFDYQLVKGNVRQPFPNKHSVILTATTAKKYFGNTDAIGKTILGDTRDPYTVSGVIADFPANSSIKADMLFPMELRKSQYDGKGGWKSLDEDWGDYFADTYLLLRPDASVSEIGHQLTKIHLSLHKGIKPTDGVYVLQPLADIHLFNPDGSPAGRELVTMFTIIAVLILLIACINYVNLSTARASLRSKEVSLRKITGATRRHLIVQFIIEAMLCFALASVLAFIVIEVVMPYYNSLSGKQLHVDLLNAAIMRVIAIIILTTLTASSIYPAILLSSFKPVKALKGKISGLDNAMFRKVLVVCQFSFSIGLIIGTIVINRQLRFIQSARMGYNRDHIFTVKLDWMGPHYNAIRADLLTHPEITGVASGSSSVVESYSSTGDTDWDGKPLNASMIINSFEIDKDFIKLFNIKMAAGSNFTGTKADSTHFILNETAVKLAGIKNPVGKRFKLFRINGTIIGVVKDFHFASLKQAIQPAIFTYSPVSSRMFIKTNSISTAAAIKAVEAYWKQYNITSPYSYYFLDDEFNSLYKTEQQTGALFSIFTGIAILISCLGLFGLATYTAQVKVKEIGIRRVLGASVINVTALLCRGFFVLVVIAILIASPVAWYLMNKWLQGYAYRAPMRWWIMGLAGAGALLIALVIISFQAVKAALINPVKSLKSE